MNELVLSIAVTSRFFNDDSLNSTFPFWIVGYFVLCDSGCYLSKKVMVPFRGERYHLKDFCFAGPESRPSNAKELFNLRHSAKRTSRAECGIGLLKSRFRILTLGMEGSITTLTLQTNACITLHNFIQRRCGRDDTLTTVGKLAIEQHMIHTRIYPQLHSRLSELAAEEGACVITSDAKLWRQDLADRAYYQYQQYLTESARTRAALLDSEDVANSHQDEQVATSIRELQPDRGCF